MDAPNTISTDLGTLITALPSLRRLTSLTLPIKAAYHVAKLARLVSQEGTLFEEQRDALVKQLGEERPPTDEETKRGVTGSVTQVTEANLPEFKRKVAELALVSVTIPWAPISLELLGEVAISADDLMSLGPLFAGNSESLEAPK